MRILLVKTSSLGDVVHNLPVASDLCKHFPDVIIDWVVEEAFADIPRQHPGVRRVLPVALRRWRRQLLNPATWREWRAFRAAVRAEPYDLVIDTQGLLKSGLIVRQARGKRCGYDADSAREPLAARCYEARFAVSRERHAVERNRQLAGAAADYVPAGAPDYGIARPVAIGERAVLLTATSRDDKLWFEADWIALGQSLAARGIAARLPGGSALERERATRIAAAIPDALALPAMGLATLADELAGARLVIGVDTGLVHLAAALGRPTLAIYRASDPALTGVLAGPQARNLGRRGQPPTADEVIAIAESLL